MMTTEQAEKFRLEYHRQVARLGKTGKAELTRIDHAELAAAGRQRLFGQMSKDELIREILDLRGYGTDRFNEATHVLHHAATWDGCTYCKGE
jgi:hypothetical protein